MRLSDGHAQIVYYNKTLDNIPELMARKLVVDRLLKSARGR